MSLLSGGMRALGGKISLGKERDGMGEHGWKWTTPRHGTALPYARRDTGDLGGALRPRRRSIPRGCRTALALVLLYTVLGSSLEAQDPPRETTTAPAAVPSRLPGTPPTPRPAAPSGSESPGTASGAPAGPLEFLPSAQERLLVPVPSQFNWLQRSTPSNPLLESLLGLQLPSRLTVSVSLTEEGSDNFAHHANKGHVDARTGVTLGTVYRLDDSQKFLSLANTLRAFYQARSGETQLGFANVALNAGYQWERLSFGLSESLVRDDTTEQDTTRPLLQSQQRFLRNSVSPQVRYDISATASGAISYTHTVVINEESGQGGDSMTHAVSAHLQRQFSARLAGGLHYTFSTSTSTGSDVVTRAGSRDSASRSHRPAADLGYTLDTETRLTLGAFGLLVDRGTAGGRDSVSYGATIGVRRQLFSTVSLVASVGPTVIKREGQGEKLRANWNISLDGPIPLFTTPTLTLTLTTHQNVEDTTGEVDDAGLVLRQNVEARLTYRPTVLFNAALFVEYARTELLEETSTSSTTQGRLDNLTSAGITASYALSNTISLTGSYRYQRRDASGGRNQFDENRVTVALTGTFPVF